MNKLDKTETAIIVATTWAAAYLAAVMYTHDGWRSLGASIWFVLLGFAAVGTINRRRKKTTAGSIK